MNKIKYNGNAVFAPFNAGLYGIDDDPDSFLLYKETKENIMREFKSAYENEIVTRLAKAGIRYHGLEWYSPRFYNYETDSIDLIVSVADMAAFRAACETKRDDIQRRLDENKSGPGYMSFTPATYAEAVDEVSIVCIASLLSGITFDDEAIYEWLVYEYPCDTCDRIHSHDLEYGDDEQKAAVKACEAKTMRV